MRATVINVRGCELAPDDDDDDDCDDDDESGVAAAADDDDGNGEEGNFGADDELAAPSTEGV